MAQRQHTRLSAETMGISDKMPIAAPPIKVDLILLLICFTNSAEARTK
jgi:hypothetical protein